MITVLLFAHLREQLQTGKIFMDQGPMTVEELLNEIGRQYPLLKLDKVMVAVNEELVDSGEIIQPGDTVALLPPVSGG